MVLLGVGLVAMLVISGLYFSALGMKKIAIFNGVYLSSCLLVFVGLPASILMLFHIVLIAVYVALARMG